jgi:hypothetical protein
VDFVTDSLDSVADSRRHHFFDEYSLHHALHAGLEETRLILQKEVSSMRSNLHDVEAARLELERVAKDARRRAKCAEAEVMKLADELKRVRSDFDGCLRLADDSKNENESLKLQVSALGVIYMSPCFSGLF